MCWGHHPPMMQPPVCFLQCHIAISSSRHRDLAHSLQCGFFILAHPQGTPWFPNPNSLPLFTLFSYPEQTHHPPSTTAHTLCSSWTSVQTQWADPSHGWVDSPWWRPPCVPASLPLSCPAGPRATSPYPQDLGLTREKKTPEEGSEASLGIGKSSTQGKEHTDYDPNAGKQGHLWHWSV